jgi:hypothetical protein
LADSAADPTPGSIDQLTRVRMRITMRTRRTVHFLDAAEPFICELGEVGRLAEPLYFEGSWPFLESSHLVGLWYLAGLRHLVGL